MKKLLSLSSLAAGALLLASTAVAHADTFAATYVVQVNSSDPGLVIQTDHGPGNPGSFSVPVTVNDGPTALNNLFALWTDESAVNSDDLVPKPITATFNFTLPQNFGITDPGQTSGQTQVFGFFQNGHVHWNDPVSVETGFGTVTLNLFDADFNSGKFFGLDEGPCDGTYIDGQISAVPEPVSLALLGGGLLVFGWHRRRANMA